MIQIFLLALLLVSQFGCKAEKKTELVESPIATSLPKFGSEVDHNGVKSRLFGCLPEDQNCNRRSELVSTLGCDWVSDEKCVNCDKLDLDCLENLFKDTTAKN